MAVLSLPVVLLRSAASTGGRVVGAGGVAKERIKTDGRVVKGGCVAKERIKTDGRVVAAGCYG